MSKILMPLFVCLFSLTAFSQDRIVTGTVKDSEGRAVAGASIMVRKAAVTVTKPDGTFSATVPAGVKSLTVRSVGMADQEVTIGSGPLNVVMQSFASDLENVVVVGYQRIPKSKITGSIGKISGAEIENKPVLSFDQAFSGKAAGVQIGTASGLVGDNVIIRVRGAASISSGSQPLIVMDGVPIIQGNNGQLYNPANTLADINPNDIESVEVLKDAAASALYGSRASGGVILITTKKGKSGKASLAYDGYIGVTQPSKRLAVLNGEEYNTVINKMRSNAGLANIAAYGDIDGNGTIDPYNTDWQSAVYRNGLTQNHQVSLSGGTDKANYFASLSYNDFENYIIVNRQKRISGRMNLTTKVTSWLETGIKTQYSQTTSYGLGSGTGSALSGVPFGPLTAYPNVPIYGPTGDYYIGAGGNSPLNNTPNPVAVQQLNYDTRNSKRLIASAYAEALLFKGLRLKTQYNIDQLLSDNDQWWDPAVGDGSGLAGVAQTINNFSKTWTWFSTLNYNTKIATDHDINALLGSEFTRNRSGVFYTSGLGLNDPLFRLITTSNYQTVSADNSIGINNGLASYFGALNYGFKNKYLATFNFRADAYSGFGKDNRWGYFPSGSVAWFISRENFWSINAISELKLRSSYGITGNSNIGSFPSLATYAPTTYADIPSLNLTNPGNSSLKWERTSQFDVGLDATIGKGITIAMDYYKKNTQDLILNSPVLATLGFPGNSLSQNIGHIENSGVELTVNVPVVEKRDFKWNIAFNAAWNKNKVISTNATSDDIPGGAGLARPGYNLGAFYLIRWAGVNPANGLPTFFDVNGVRKQYDQGAPAANRWTRVSDGAVTTAITAADRILDNSMTPYPKFFGGMNQSFNFRQFSLSFDLQYSFGQYTYNSTKSTLLSFTTNRNKSTEILSAWTKAGDVTDVPRLFYGDNQFAQASTRFAEKSDFVRMRNIQLGYEFPKSMLTKMKLNTLRMYAQMQNAFTITNYSGVDPEANANGNTNIGLGVDQFRPYLPRVITFGISLGL